MFKKTGKTTTIGVAESPKTKEADHKAKVPPEPQKQLDQDQSDSK